MITTPKIDRRAWLALWLQGRRRKRRIPSELSGLSAGLQHFYVAQSGATFLRSWNETEALGITNPFEGMIIPGAVVGTGNYPAETSLLFTVLPYREDAGGRLYAGTMLRLQITPGSFAFGVVWPAWTAFPGWTTGYAVLRYANYEWNGYRHVAAAAFQNGWTDDGTGWSDGTGIDFNHPPRAAKVMWNQPNNEWQTMPGPMPVVMSPLGGAAFDSTFGSALTRSLCDDLRRNVDGTFAFWFSPALDGQWVGFAALRGLLDLGFYFKLEGLLPEQVVSADSQFGVSWEDAQAGDWYLVVMRNDVIEDTIRLDVARLRDGTWRRGSGTLAQSFVVPLTAGSDYPAEGLGSVLTVGGSWFWWEYAYGYYDRIGLWDRPLTDDEVEELFSSGLGWQPN